MAKGGLTEVAKMEITAANKAGMNEILKPQYSRVNVSRKEAPPKKIVNKQIAGVDVLELESAQQLLWDDGIYAETGMGCTGPIIIVASEDLDNAKVILKKNKLIQ